MQAITCYYITRIKMQHHVPSPWVTPGHFQPLPRETPRMNLIVKHLDLNWLQVILVYNSSYDIHSAIIILSKWLSLLSGNELHAPSLSCLMANSSLKDLCHCHTQNGSDASLMPSKPGVLPTQYGSAPPPRASKFIYSVVGIIPKQGLAGPHLSSFGMTMTILRC